MVNEDLFWEDYRERYEHGFLPVDEWDKPQKENDYLYLDDEEQREEVEQSYGHDMEDMGPEELREIVEHFTDEDVDEDTEPWWDEKNERIFYCKVVA